MSLQLNELRTPKQGRRTSEGVAGWYSYYAGYSPLFVSDMLTSFAVPPGESVLDPWNGMGTTTQVARERGIHAVGFDLNPVAVIVAKARQLHCGVLPSIPSLCAEIIQMAKDDSEEQATAPESLCAWFLPAAASTIRRIEASIRRLLVCGGSYCRIIDLTSLDTVSDLAAFFFTALFRVVRRLLMRFQTSNPAWIKQNVAEGKRVAVSSRKVLSLFQGSVEQMTPALSRRNIELDTNCRLDVGSSTLLPLPKESVAAVITSPPYCTRIDYAVTTSPELAVLGMNLSSELRALRDRMIGTSTIANTPRRAKANWGPTSGALVRRIEEHPSRAARSYYLKTYLQYFNGLQLSIAEISRVLKKGGVAALVVQDSYFKEVRVRLGDIIAEMGSYVHFAIAGRADFPIERTMCAVHPHARKYRKSVSTMESVVVLSKS